MHIGAAPHHAVVRLRLFQEVNRRRSKHTAIETTASGRPAPRRDACRRAEQEHREQRVENRAASEAEQPRVRRKDERTHQRHLNRQHRRAERQRDGASASPAVAGTCGPRTHDRKKCALPAPASGGTELAYQRTVDRCSTGPASRRTPAFARRLRVMRLVGIPQRGCPRRQNSTMNTTKSASSVVGDATFANC